MKSLRYSFLSLLLAIWIGSLIFFSFVQAPVTFGSLADTHQAGTIVGKSLRILHWIGLSCGIPSLLLLLSPADGEGKRKIAVAFLSVMLSLTAVSQFVVIPKMEAYRIQAGGAVQKASATNEARIGFEKLHGVSEKMEGGVLLLGLALFFLVPTPLSSKSSSI